MAKSSVQEQNLPQLASGALTDKMRVTRGGQSAEVLASAFPFAPLVNNIVPPQYVPYGDKEVVEVANYAALPVTGDSSKRYVTLDDLHSFFWTTAGYIDATDGGLTIGETSGTAGRGDWNKIAYDFSQGTLIEAGFDIDTFYNGRASINADGIGAITIEINGTTVGISAVYATGKGSGATQSSTQLLLGSRGEIAYRDYTTEGWWAWKLLASTSDILGIAKIATVTFLRTTTLPSYTEVNGVLTASANGTLTLDNSQTPVNGQTLFYSVNNKCYTITNKGSVSTAWVLTEYLPNSVSNSPILFTTTLASLWFYTGSTYNRVYTKTEADALLALKVDKATGYSLLQNTKQTLYDSVIQVKASTTDIDSTTFSNNLEEVFYQLIEGEEYTPLNSLTFKTVTLGNPNPEETTFVQFAYGIDLEGYYFIKQRTKIGIADWGTWGDTSSFGQTGAGDYSAFNSYGLLQMFGAATTWDDDNLDPTTLTGVGTAPASINFGSSTIRIASFVNAATDQVNGARELPHKWKIGSPITFHAHVHPTTTNTGTVRLGLEYSFVCEGATPTTPVTIYAEAAMSGTVFQMQTINFAEITPPSALGCQFHFRFFRDGSNGADTFTGGAAISTIGYHYQADQLGSRLITTK